MTQSFCFLSMILFVSIYFESSALSWSFNTKSIRKIITQSSLALLLQPILPLSLPQIQTISWADSTATSSSSTTSKAEVTSLELKDLDPEAIDTYRKGLQNEKEGELKVRSPVNKLDIYICVYYMIVYFYSSRLSLTVIGYACCR